MFMRAGLQVAPSSLEALMPRPKTPTTTWVARGEGVEASGGGTREIKAMDMVDTGAEALYPDWGAKEGTGWKDSPPSTLRYRPCWGAAHTRQGREGSMAMEGEAWRAGPLPTKDTPFNTCLNVLPPSVDLYKPVQLEGMALLLVLLTPR